jgi:multiple sugar transport system substrate-binding protein
MTFRNDNRGLNRRALLGGAASVALTLPMLAAHDALAEELRRNIWVKVLCPHPPDPSPPGVAPYGVDLFNAWQWRETIWVAYEPVAWSLLEMRIEAALNPKTPSYDMLYMSGWVPRFHDRLAVLDEFVPGMLLDDLPAASLTSFTWNDSVYGLPFSLSIMTLFANTDHLTSAGITAPPATWSELRGIAEALTGDGRYGWVANYGRPEGIGGTASLWMAFLQQAGGTMYRDDGLPAFNDVAGVDALQFLVDLMPFTHPSSWASVGIDDATMVFQRGEAALMMNWPFMWRPVNDPAISTVAGAVTTAVLPAGPAGTASIDGAEGWTLAGDSRNVDEAFSLMLFFLNRRIQAQMAQEMGWLPIRLSVLEDPLVQATAPHAAVALEQAKHPYDSFLTPDYAAITSALGVEIQRALTGEKTAAQALADAESMVTAIIQSRPST